VLLRFQDRKGGVATVTPRAKTRKTYLTVTYLRKPGQRPRCTTRKATSHQALGSLSLDRSSLKYLTPQPPSTFDTPLRQSHASRIKEKAEAICDGCIYLMHKWKSGRLAVTHRVRRPNDGGALRPGAAASQPRLLL
jgi:hypothetical protein